MTKICKKCNVEKTSDCFYLSKRHVEGFGNECKQCVCSKRQIWYKNNTERSKEYVTKWRENNSDKVHQYRKKSKEKLGPENLYEYHKNYRSLNAERIGENRRRRDKERLATDQNYVTMRRLRRRIFMAFKKSKGIKQESTLELLGCSIIELRKYIENKFVDGMGWNNWGSGFLTDDKGKAVRNENNRTIPIKQWHLDHIRPVSSFDLTDKEQQHQCFHYTNLQPLWATDNLTKGNKLV